MPEIEIRPAIKEDIAVLMELDHTYQTLYAWQMDRVIDTSQVSIRFREVRLPRLVNVEYPRSVNSLEERSSQYLLMLTALFGGVPVGYLGITEHAESQSAIATDLVVKTEFRRQGIGSALLLSGQAWANQQGLRSFILEMQSKNYTMIRLARKMGFEFCGYKDQYFPNQDIAIFFMRFLK